MKRRTFLQAAATAPFCGQTVGRDDELRRQTIVRLSGFTHRCPRPKFVGKNSHLDDHGDHTSERVLIVRTNAGIEGFGAGHLEESVARKLLGASVDQLWTDGVGSTGALGRADHALFDLVGKIRGVPAWSLVGTAGPEWVDVYDGSIYFNDLLPQYEKLGAGQLVKELEAGLERGFRAFKIKVGRGYKWMPRAEGFARDLEVVRALRRAAGADVRLMVDANNGFDLVETKRFLKELEAERLFFVEEMFPEEVALDLELKQYIREQRWQTLVADCESAGEIAHFEPYLKARALDVYQPDIRALGLSRQWAMSRTMKELDPHARLAPHNWGSNLGQYMQLQLARGIGNFLMAEVDTGTSDLFDDAAYHRKEGKVMVPDAPGCGLTMRQDVYRQKYRDQSWVVE